jgi:hypothetical protein
MIRYPYPKNDRTRMKIRKHLHSWRILSMVIRLKAIAICIFFRQISDKNK